ncbi:JmjC domain-containing histone demethylation protein 1 [Candida viswanathii]|uniref:JmjC domain-containing histone demethylation protein 1 n=1 Tax=Candida viswanathii TaxID=5486 RepID=A0A367YK01_9ASCO|nr:JmjC domain-containing histone demethylation protein 1 [Candida viswanathii]
MPSSTDVCPLCTNSDEDSWIQCSHCKQWYHTTCLKIPTLEVNTIVTYHCPKCIPSHGPSTYKRKSKRSKVAIDYQALDDGEAFAVDKTNHFQLNNFLTFKGTPDIHVIKELTKEFALGSRMTKPILIPQADVAKNGMAFPIPRGKITVDYVTECCGEDTPLEVMDVISQQSLSPAWRLKQWRDYFNTEEQLRDRIRNVISLEISDVANLGVEFKRPTCVEDLDLVDKIWDPEDDQPRSKVTKYCLMSVKNSFTDFHIDFGGTSVYYTVCRGAKTFLMFPPTENNLRVYESWCLEPKQNFIWYPEHLITKNKKRIYPAGGFKVTLQPGDLFIIPSGWIHAVHTPQDSVVIGGNYLTLRDMKMQLRINEVEKLTRVPSKFRFPMFNKVLWLSAWYYYNHRDEFLEDIDEEDGEGILGSLIEHLTKHLELSKTNAAAKRSIPLAIGKPTTFLEKLATWKETRRP